MRICKHVSAGLLAIVSCFAQCAPAWAESQGHAKRCTESVKDVVAEHFGLENFFYGHGGLLVASACKEWPVSDPVLITAFAYDQGVKYEKLLILAIINSQTNQILSSYKTQVHEDASLTVGEDSLRIDTAPYNIAPGIRAFGIDMESGYLQGCGDGGSGPSRTLYIIDKASLRPVLHLDSISYWNYVQEGTSPCAPQIPINVKQTIQYFSLTLEIGSTITAEHRDIIVHAKSSRDDGKPTRKGTFSYVLRYKNSEYSTDGMYAAFEKWRR